MAGFPGCLPHNFLLTFITLFGTIRAKSLKENMEGGMDKKEYPETDEPTSYFGPRKRRPGKKTSKKAARGPKPGKMSKKAVKRRASKR